MHDDKMTHVPLVVTLLHVLTQLAIHPSSYQTVHPSIHPLSIHQLSIHQSIHRPGQFGSSLQFWMSSLLPWQSFPTGVVEGAGLEQARSRLLVG
jgi:hypothetical protein